ncbi:MAG: hypothetical protein IJ867_02685 [Clostridia bacterium]|nr:hypothetical protein [Clostridia bacterium]
MRKYVVGCFVLISVILIIIIVNKKSDNFKKSEFKNEVVSEAIHFEEDETGTFVLYDGETNTVKVEIEDEAGLQIYMDNPDYNPNPTY